MENARRRIALILTILLFSSVCTVFPAQAGVNLIRHGARDDNRNQLIYYYLFAPGNPPAGLPLVIYLHGSGEQGDNALNASLPMFLREGKVLSDNVIVMVPQMPSNLGKWIGLDDALTKMIERTEEEFGIDESRIALVGFSLGAIGVYDLVNLHPERFCRAVSVSGRVNEDVTAEDFATCELYTFVGTKDVNVPPKSALDFAQAVADAGYVSEVVQLEQTHSRMPFHVFQDENLLEKLWMELAPRPTPAPSPTPKSGNATDESGFRTLKRGMNGRDVQRFKTAMYWLGYFRDKNVSDEYNSITVERVKKLQKYNGLEETGIADPALQALVFSGNAIATETAPKPSKTPKPADTPKP